MIVQVYELDGNDNVKVVVSGMFFNDPAPPSPAGKTIVLIIQHPLESNIESNKEKILDQTVVANILRWAVVIAHYEVSNKLLSFWKLKIASVDLEILEKRYITLTDKSNHHVIDDARIIAVKMPGMQAL